LELTETAGFVGPSGAHYRLFVQVNSNGRHHHRRPRLRFLVLLAALVACTPADHAARPAADSLAAAIERELPQMRRDTATVFDLSTEGATIDAAYRGDTLRRLHLEGLGETGRVDETFYFDPGLVLVLRIEAHYDAPLSGRVVDSTISRFDLSLPNTPRSLADSLEASARALLLALAARGT
jgi:hypothetical protein